MVRVSLNYQRAPSLGHTGVVAKLRAGRELPGTTNSYASHREWGDSRWKRALFRFHRLTHGDRRDAHQRSVRG